MIERNLLSLDSRDLDKDPESRLIHVPFIIRSSCSAKAEAEASTGPSNKSHVFELLRTVIIITHHLQWLFYEFPWWTFAKNERRRKNEAEIVIAADEYEKARRWEISKSIFLVNDMEMIQ